MVHWNGNACLDLPKAMQGAGQRMHEGGHQHACKRTESAVAEALMHVLVVVNALVSALLCCPAACWTATAGTTQRSEAILLPTSREFGLHCSPWQGLGMHRQ